MTKKPERNEELVSDEATAEASRDEASPDEAMAERSSGVATADDEPPPFGGSWRVLYAAVLVNLVFLIVLFYIFTKAFA